MPKIIYRYLNGSEVGQWTGIAYRNKDGLPRKKGQIFLGKVIDKEKLIFWKRAKGFYRFNPETLACEPVPTADLPTGCPVEQGHAKKSPLAIVDFGDAFFLDTLLEGLHYKEVLRHIHCPGTDTLLALLSFFILDNSVASRALSWCSQSYASYLYPDANLQARKIREILRSIGSPENMRAFFTAHIRYILDNTDTNMGVLVESTELHNGYDMPGTHDCLFDEEIDIDSRLITVVQKKTGLPLYYEYLPDAIDAIDAIARATIILSEYQCEVQYCIRDEEGDCPVAIEKLCLLGTDFMTRLSPNCTLFKKVFEENKERLLRHDGLMRCGDRFVNIVKVSCEIARDRETGESHAGFIYLCVDHQERAGKIARLLEPPLVRLMTTEELMAMQDPFGVFAIVTTRDLSEAEVLAEYDVRQKSGPFVDCARRGESFLPAGMNDEETYRGYLLLAFLSSFLSALLRNRLDTAARKYVEVLSTSDLDPEKLSRVSFGRRRGDARTVTAFEQSVPAEISDVTAEWLFATMRGQKANVFPGRIIPSAPTGQVMAVYEAFALGSPLQVRREGQVLRLIYERTSPPGISRCRTLAFSRRIPLADREILRRQKKISNEPAVPDGPVQNDTASADDTASAQQPESKNTPKRRGGRPKGSKNKKTLDREQQIAAGLVPPPTPKKRGRKPGSKDKVKRTRRTKAQLAAVRDEAAVTKDTASDGV